mmetsp:Transcript_99091/g.212282  ORF Transcript_99091/g.212282 Transcript_99091/m.212282 type:complete len:544 (+) Transcript_99091:180-1811(+)
MSCSADADADADPERAHESESNNRTIGRLPSSPLNSRVPNEAVADVHKALLKESDKMKQSYEYSSMSKTTRCQSAPRSLGHEDCETAEIREYGASLRTPGGFRRQYLHAQADSSGVPREDRPTVWSRSFMSSLNRKVLCDAPLGMRLDPLTGKEMECSEEGTAENMETAVAIFKSFIGSGITFMPWAFCQGGWLFSVIFLVVIGALNYYCIVLLLRTADRTGMSNFGDIAELVFGFKGKIAVQFSLVSAQFGICIAYFIFISDLAESIGVGERTMMEFLLIPVLAPLCLIKNVDSLGYANLAADLCIMFGIIVMFVYSGLTIHQGGVSHVSKFESSSWGIFLGTAIFSFEGLPLVLPIRSAMAKPQGFLRVFTPVFILVVALVMLAGFLGYFAYGSSVHTTVLIDMPRSKNKLGPTAKLAFMFALALSTPLQFLPAARVTELWAFGVMKPTVSHWRQNILRLLEVTAFALIAYFGDKVFGKILAIIGAFCSCPIGIIYPTIFHLKLCAKSRPEVITDVFLLGVGLAAMVLTAYFTFGSGGGHA